MPDGTYLQYDTGFSTSSASGSSWFMRAGAYTLMGGVTSINGDTIITFPYAFPNAGINIIASEAGAAGWGGAAVGVFGQVMMSRVYATIRCAVKQNGGVFSSPASGQTANWIAIGY